ncbi:hypothetical protein [Archangium violaceum]|uniref:hypothetical protein n=1 Tax=Archangium violaceum TaxID=83451 RepID=UPI00126990F1|nr:hypothetical protein [Archangium violaceum]
MAEVNRCWEARLVSDADLGRVLQLARRRLVEWYELDARASSAILLGDSTLDDAPPRRGRQSWASIYQFVIARLAELEGPLVNQDVGLTEQLLRVDAQAVRVLDTLQRANGQTPGSSQAQEVEAAVTAFRDQLLAEATAWSEHPRAHHGPVQTAQTMPEVLPSKSWGPNDRIGRVATLVYWITTQWGMHSLELHRGTLGVGFQGYLEAFRRREAHAPLNERLTVAWPMYVHTASITERGTLKRVDEVLQDIVYDNLNLMGYFAMRDAQNTWLMLLPSTPGNPNSQSLTAELAQDRLNQAAHALVYAWETTTSREVRLRNVAALINQADLVFVQPVQTEGAATQEGDPRIPWGARLAELGLCLLNQALFEGPHAPCPPEYAAVEARLAPGEQTWCPQETEVAAPFFDTAPPEALEAYRRVLGTLVVAGTRLTARSQCGVLALLRKQPLASLHADATLLQAAVELVEARQVPLGPRRMGEFLAAAVSRLRMDVSAPCIRLGLSSGCSLPEILQAIKQPPFPDPHGWAKLWHARFCTSAKAGARVLTIAQTRLKGGSGDFTDFVTPLTVHQLNDYRSDFLTAAAACREASVPVEEQTPDMRLPKGAVKSAKPLASRRGTGTPVAREPRGASRSAAAGMP